MYSDARNWKWMTPSAVFGLLLIVTRWLLMSSSEEARWVGVMTGVICAVCAIAAIGNFVDYRRAQFVSIFERQQRARSLTALSQEMESARGVHPDSVALIINERHRVWMLKSGVQSQGIMPHSVLYGAPDVTEYFLQYFLENSSDKVVMPKRLLVQGRKNRFDPYGVVDEYTMYDRLLELLATQGKVMMYAKYMQYEWIAPWSPRLVAEDFGLIWTEDESIVEEVKK